MNFLRFLARRPWLMVVAAFILLISAWTVLIYIAVKNRPEEVANPLDPGARVLAPAPAAASAPSNNGADTPDSPDTTPRTTTEGGTDGR